MDALEFTRGEVMYLRDLLKELSVMLDDLDGMSYQAQEEINHAVELLEANL